MPLREHLRELRNRLLESALAIVRGRASPAGSCYQPVFEALMRPDPRHRATRSTAAPRRSTSPTRCPARSTCSCKLSIYHRALICVSPIWLYQLWAFITPGLTKRGEALLARFRRRRPCRCSSPAPCSPGCVLPKAVEFLTEFTPGGRLEHHRRRRLPHLRHADRAGLRHRVRDPVAAGRAEHGRLLLGPHAAQGLADRRLPLLPVRRDRHPYARGRLDAASWPAPMVRSVRDRRRHRLLVDRRRARARDDPDYEAWPTTRPAPL